MSRHGASTTTVFPDRERIPSKIKRKQISETFIKGKEIIKEPDNPSKRVEETSIIDEKEHNSKKHLHHLKIR